MRGVVLKSRLRTVRLPPSLAETFEREATAAGFETTDYIGNGYWGPVVFVDEDRLAAVERAFTGDLDLKREYGRWVIHPRL